MSVIRYTASVNGLHFNVHCKNLEDHDDVTFVPVCTKQTCFPTSGDERCRPGGHHWRTTGLQYNTLSKNMQLARCSCNISINCAAQVQNPLLLTNEHFEFHLSNLYKNKKRKDDELWL